MRAQYEQIKRAIPQNLIELVKDGSDIELQDNQRQQQQHTIHITDLFHVNKELLKSKRIYERVMHFKLDGFRLGLKVQTLKKIRKLWNI